MPRPPDPKSKTRQLIIKPKAEWELEFQAMKQICARNGISLSQEVYERAVKTFLRDHNWPPGNSQTQIVKFVDKQLVEKRKCEYPQCNEDAVCISYSKLQTAKPKVYLCEAHKRHSLENQLLKGYKPL